MIVFSEEYQTYVLDDIKTYQGLYHPVKSTFVERFFRKSLPLELLHPNPDDEFCNPSIGPNEEIVSSYVKMFCMNGAQRELTEPLSVEKMSTGGYMILNGHHRWMAAIKLGKSRLPVEIVNVTPDHEIIALMETLKNSMCISFDLDEVLLEENPDSQAMGIYSKRIRLHAAEMIEEFRKMGFDIWVYTGEYYSEDYIHALFHRKNTSIDGIVSGLSKRKGESNLREAFRKKYKISIHIDNETIIYVDTIEKSYEIYDIIEDGERWAAAVTRKMKELDIYETI